MSNERVGFIGLGVMGRAMAANILKAGYSVTVHNRSRGVVDLLVAEGAKAAIDSSAVAGVCDIVITMLPDIATVERVYFGEAGLFAAAKPGQLFIDMSTSSREVALRIDAAAQRVGAASLDAPVSGGDVGARDGTLSIMAGGPKAAFDRAHPVFAAMGKNVVHVGEAGAGQVTKACNQIVVGLTIEAVGEALTLAAKAGVSPEKVRAALLGGFAQSRILDLHGQRALDNRYSPGARLRLHRKDLDIALDIAHDVDAALPVTAIVREMMNSLIARGMGDLDHSVLIRHLADQSGTQVHEDTVR